MLRGLLALFGASKPGIADSPSVRLASAGVLTLLILCDPAAVYAQDNPPSASVVDRPWRVALFAGPLSAKDSSEILFEGEWGSSTPVAGIAIRRRIVEPLRDVDLSVEPTASRRGGDHHLWDLALLGVGSWTWQGGGSAPGLTLSAGYGPSWVSRQPDSVRDGGEAMSPWLAKLMAEIELRPDPEGPISFVARYEHRSSTFGLFGGNGQQDEITAVLFGLSFGFGL